MASLYRAGQAAELLGVSVDRVRRWCDDGSLPTERTEGGHRLIEGAALARFVAENAHAFEAEHNVSSARNRLAGLVTRVETDKLTAVIEIQAGPHRIVSLMTREAAEDLGLAAGDVAVAVVKSTNVIVEVPDR